MNVEVRAALLLIAVIVPAVLAALWAIDSPRTRLPTVAGIAFLAAAAVALALGWAVRW